MKIEEQLNYNRSHKMGTAVFIEFFKEDEMAKLTDEEVRTLEHNLIQIKMMFERVWNITPIIVGTNSKPKPGSDSYYEVDVIEVSPKLTQKT